MLFLNVQLVFCSTVLWTERLEARAQALYSDYENRPRGNVYYETENRFRGGRSSTELPVSFKAPNFGSLNYWNYKPNRSPVRRTFFDSLEHYNYGKPSMFPDLGSFFEFMNPFLEDKSNFKPTSSTISKAILEPYKYEYPFKYHLSTSEKKFLPPPKPIRASIIKLETVTNTPILHPLPGRILAAADYYPKFSTAIPLPVDRPVLHIDGLGFRSTNNKEDPTVQLLRVSTESSNETAILPIPTNVTIIEQAPEEQKNIFQIVTDLTTSQPEIVNNANSAGTIQHFQANETKLRLVPVNTDIKNISNHVRYSSYDGKSRGDLVITSIVSKPRPVKEEKTRGDNYNKGDSALRTQKEGSSIKIVTDLTLKGLQKNKKQTANIPRYTKIFNMSDLIDYELNKLKHNKVLKPRSDDAESENVSPLRDFNENDELSLDLKILKDTHWDGFTTQSSETSTNDPKGLMGNKTVNNSLTTETIVSDKQTKKRGSVIKYHDNAFNKTTIVETRVTKTVSKIWPINYLKYKKMNETTRQNHTWNEDQNSKHTTQFHTVGQIDDSENSTSHSTERRHNALNTMTTTSGSNSDAYPLTEDTELNTTSRYRPQKYKFDQSSPTTKSFSHKTNEVSPAAKENNSFQEVENFSQNNLENITKPDTGLTAGKSIPANSENVINAAKARKGSRRRKPKKTTKSKRRRNGHRRHQMDQR